FSPVWRKCPPPARNTPPRGDIPTHPEPGHLWGVHDKRLISEADRRATMPIARLRPSRRERIHAGTRRAAGRRRRHGARLAGRPAGKARRRRPMARWFVDRQPQRGIPSVSLRRLLPEARFVGCPDWEVSGCTDDHRRLDPGQVFVAIRDARYDGQAFVGEALDRGAAGVVVESHCPEAGRLQVIVDDARTAHARICQALAGDPSRQMATIGVTGTFGKTIASLFVRSILEAAGRRCGLIGALEWSDG